MEYNTIGLVGRFRPLHNGGASLLESCLKRTNQLRIGIGSANVYDARNPFTPIETQEMMTAYFEDKNISFDRYQFLQIQDHYGAKLPDGSLAWTNEVNQKLGPLDAFMSGNKYVQELLGPNYNIIDSLELTRSDNQFQEVNASTVRQLIVNDQPWNHLVPNTTFDYIRENSLDERLKDEFGVEIRAAQSNFGLTYEQEKARIANSVKNTQSI